MVFWLRSGRSSSVHMLREFQVAAGKLAGPPLERSSCASWEAGGAPCNQRIAHTQIRTSMSPWCISIVFFSFHHIPFSLDQNMGNPGAAAEVCKSCEPGVPSESLDYLRLT